MESISTTGLLLVANTKVPLAHLYVPQARRSSEVAPLGETHMFLLGDQHYSTLASSQIDGNFLKPE